MGNRFNFASYRSGGVVGKVKNRFSKVIVALVILLNVGFTTAVLYAFLQVGSEPTALIAAWFAFTTGELWLLSGIKKEKIKHGREDGFGTDNRDKYPI